MDLYTQTYNNIPKGWEELFMNAEPEIQHISELLETEKNKGKRIVPLQENIFKIFHMCPPEKLTVVIVGQDPYPQILSSGQPRAQGLSFSVSKEDEIPSSLRNIYKEIANCYPDSEEPKNGDISHWVSQGVFLLNVCLTCEAYAPDSHAKYKLWMPFVTKFLKFMTSVNKDLIFVLWGGQAQKLEDYVEKGFKNILKAVHPSGLSANRGFFGCGHFKIINEMLTKFGHPNIEWLPRKKSMKELLITLLSKYVNEEELNQLSQTYESEYSSLASKTMTLQEYTVYAITYIVHSQKQSDTYENFLKKITEYMESHKNVFGFYDYILSI